MDNNNMDNNKDDIRRKSTENFLFFPFVPKKSNS